MKYFVCLFICSFVSFSCISQKRDVVAKSTIKFESKSTNLGDLICIQGFYHNPSYSNYGSPLFFEDGTFINLQITAEIGKNKIKNLFDYAAHMENKGQIGLIGRRGIYTIQNDTIIGHIYVPSSLLVGWVFDEVRYKIVDRKTINRIYVKGLLEADEKYYRESGKSPWINEDNMCFVPVDSLPPPDNWLKEEKWMCRNESDWVEYMKNKK